MYVVLNEKNNPVLDTGNQAFDIRNPYNRMCAFGQNEIMTLETPVRLGGGDFQCDSIGAFTFFNGNSSIRWVDKIGRFCMVGPNVKMGLPEHMVECISAHTIFCHADSEHSLQFGYCENHSSRPNGEKFSPPKSKIVIGNDVWIGAGAVILRGVTIGNGAIIGAGAVVSKDVHPYEIVGGVPAKHIRFRYTMPQIFELEKIKWWDYGPQIMDGINITDINNALPKLKEKIEKGFKPYICQKVIINPQEGSVDII